MTQHYPPFVLYGLEFSLQRPHKELVEFIKLLPWSFQLLLSRWHFNTGM